MAVFEIWDICGRYDHPLNYAMNEEKTSKKNFTEDELSSLQDVIRYAANSKKTTADDYQVYVTGINCNPDDARNQMADVKRKFEDESKIVCYHGFQSFAHGEVDPDTAHEIGVRFAEKMWGDRFQFIVTTHLNTKSIHNHFVINGTSFTDGKRFYDNKEHLKKARATSDKFCREYGLSVIENPVGKKVPNHIYKDNKAGMPTRQNVIKDGIDDAVAHSFTKEQFFKHMTDMGFKCDFRDSRKYSTVTAKGYEKPIRTYQIGSEYTKEKIFERIKENSYSVKFETIQPATKTMGYRNITLHSIFIAKKRGGYRGLYLHYAYRMGILPKNTQRNNARLHYLLKDDLTNLDKIDAEVRLLHRHHIDNAQQLSSYKETIKIESEELVLQRKKLWNESRSVTDPQKMADIKAKIAKCSDRLKEIRWDIKYCDDIAVRSGVIEKSLEQIEKEEQIKAQDKSKNKGKNLQIK